MHVWLKVLRYTNYAGIIGQNEKLGCKQAEKELKNFLSILLLLLFFSVSIVTQDKLLLIFYWNSNGSLAQKNMANPKNLMILK